MKTRTILLGLIGAAALTACGGSKMNAHEFEQSARAACEEHKSVHIVQHQECLVMFYEDRMEKEVGRDDLAAADNRYKRYKSSLKKNRRTLGL